MSVVSWIALAVTNASSGAKCKQQGWRLRSKSCLNSMKKLWSVSCLLLSVSVLLIIVHSPRTNVNLLQRSEVVALINTLFRFSESLSAVEHFRQMWRALDEPSSQRIVSAAVQVCSLWTTCLISTNLNYPIACSHPTSRL